MLLMCMLTLSCGTQPEPADTPAEDTDTEAPDLFADEACGLRWPADPFHAAVYSFVAEYALGFGPAVGCFLDAYPDQVFQSVATDLEDGSGGLLGTAAVDYAQAWVDDNAAAHDQPVFDLVEQFLLVTDGNSVTGGLGFGDGQGDGTDCTASDWEDDLSSSGVFEIQASPDIDESGMRCLTRHVDVLGLSVYAESGLTSAQIFHAAAVLAELLDNDEDGVVDDQALYEQLLRAEALIPMFNREGSPAYNDFVNNYRGTGVSAVLFADEVDPSQPGHWGVDATVEEIMHTINHRGHVVVYPEAFGIQPDASLLTEAMDVARGGQLLSVPSSYPEDAWYHYDDTTCDYGCMAIEYMYWAQVSLMGILDDPETCSGIADEWEPCSPELLESMDVLVYDLITDPQHRLPSRAPDGTYAPSR
jgi:hypothetical protein